MTHQCFTPQPAHGLIADSVHVNIIIEFDRDPISDHQRAYEPEGVRVNVIRDRIGEDSLASRVSMEIDRVVELWEL